MANVAPLFHFPTLFFPRYWLPHPPLDLATNWLVTSMRCHCGSAFFFSSPSRLFWEFDGAKTWFGLIFFWQPLCFGWPESSVDLCRICKNGDLGPLHWPHLSGTNALAYLLLSDTTVTASYDFCFVIDWLYCLSLYLMMEKPLLGCWRSPKICRVTTQFRRHCHHCIVGLWFLGFLLFPWFCVLICSQMCLHCRCMLYAISVPLWYWWHYCYLHLSLFSNTLMINFSEIWSHVHCCCYYKFRLTIHWWLDNILNCFPRLFRVVYYQWWADVRQIWTILHWRPIRIIVWGHNAPNGPQNRARNNETIMIIIKK